MGEYRNNQEQLILKQEVISLNEEYSGLRYTFYEEGKHYTHSLIDLYIKDGVIMANVQDENYEEFDIEWDLISNENFTTDL